MIRYPNYRRATNAAYELLIHYASFSLATNVFAIAENFLGNCKLLTYGQASFLYGYTVGNLLEVSEFGFSIVNGDKRIILYNEAMPLGSIRFTIAQEIGHFILKHRDEHDSAVEKEANCFARNLLCPLPVACNLCANSVQSYVSLFNVTPKMATVAFERQEDDRDNISLQNWGLFSEMLEACMECFVDTDEYNSYLDSSILVS